MNKIPVRKIIQEVKAETGLLEKLAWASQMLRITIENIYMMIAPLLHLAALAGLAYLMYILAQKAM